MALSVARRADCDPVGGMLVFADGRKGARTAAGRVFDASLHRRRVRWMRKSRPDAAEQTCFANRNTPDQAA